jgi:hypothetical protein
MLLQETEANGALDPRELKQMTDFSGSHPAFYQSGTTAVSPWYSGRIVKLITIPLPICLHVVLLKSNYNFSFTIHNSTQHITVAPQTQRGAQSGTFVTHVQILTVAVRFRASHHCVLGNDDSMLFLSYSTISNRRSQLPRGQRRKLSSLARALGSWARIPLKAWMFGMCMRLFCLCVVLCLGRGLAASLSLVQGVLPSVKNDYGTEKEKRPGPWMGHWKKKT